MDKRPKQEILSGYTSNIEHSVSELQAIANALEVLGMDAPAQKIKAHLRGMTASCNQILLCASEWDVTSQRRKRNDGGGRESNRDGRGDRRGASDGDLARGDIHRS